MAGWGRLQPTWRGRADAVLTEDRPALIVGGGAGDCCASGDAGCTRAGRVRTVRGERRGSTMVKEMGRLLR
jgi:hypothetical protein